MLFDKCSSMTLFLVNISRLVACAQTRTKLWLVPSAKPSRDPCSGPPNGLNELLEVRFEFPFNLF